MCLLLLFETSVEKTCAEFRKSKLHTSIGTWSACTNPVKYCGQNYLLRTPVRFYFCLWGKHTIPPCNGRRKYYCIWISLCETIQLILCDRCQMCVWGWHGLSVAVRFTFVHFCPLVIGYVHLFSISAKLCPFMLIVVYLRYLCPSVSFVSNTGTAHCNVLGQMYLWEFHAGQGCPSLIKGRCPKKKTGFFGNFSQRGGEGLLKSQNFCKFTKCFFVCQNHS